MSNLGPCRRKNNMGYWAVPGELSLVYRTCWPQPACARVKNIQTKTIADYGDIPQWLWAGSSSDSFPISVQDSILHQALTLAGTARPQGKLLVGISFFADFITGPGGYFIGAVLKFGTCTPLLPSKIS